MYKLVNDKIIHTASGKTMENFGALLEVDSVRKEATLQKSGDMLDPSLRYNIWHILESGNHIVRLSEGEALHFLGNNPVITPLPSLNKANLVKLVNYAHDHTLNRHIYDLAEGIITRPADKVENFYDILIERITVLYDLDM